MSKNNKSIKIKAKKSVVSSGKKTKSGGKSNTKSNIKVK